MRPLFAVLRVLAAAAIIVAVVGQLLLIAAVVLGVGAAVVWVSRRRANWPLSASKA